MRLVEYMPQGKAEFVVVLEVDMIPEPDWLCRIVPYVLHDGKAGLASPPQNYYNLPAGDPLGVLADELLSDCMMLLQNYTNTAFCCGTGFVARRRALEAIGGFPE